MLFSCALACISPEIEITSGGTGATDSTSRESGSWTEPRQDGAVAPAYPTYPPEGGLKLLSGEDHPGRNEELRDRLARLSGASLRISARLELDAVLREVVDSARPLTEAGGGVVVTVDEAGQPQDFVRSWPESPQSTGSWPNGPTGTVCTNT